MTNPLAAADFFALEAGECLDRLEKLAGRDEAPPAEDFLRAIADLLPARSANPFPIVTGTSAGAVNATAIAVHAARSIAEIVETIVGWARAIVGARIVDISMRIDDDAVLYAMAAAAEHDVTEVRTARDEALQRGLRVLAAER